MDPDNNDIDGKMATQDFERPKGLSVQKIANDLIV
jgi:hypothetical protein